MPVTVRTEVSIPIGRRATPATFYSFDGLPSGQEHFVVAFGLHDGQRPALVRIHSECITGEVFGSQRCDCGPQLSEALERLEDEGGVLVYLRQEGRGIGLYAKLDAYVLQEEGLDTFEANRRLNYPEDARAYGQAAEMLRAIRVTSVRLLTNNPRKVEDLRACGLEIREVVPTGVFVTSTNARYLETKITQARHTIDLGNGHTDPRAREASV